MAARFSLAAASGCCSLKRCSGFWLRRLLSWSPSRARRLQCSRLRVLERRLAGRGLGLSCCAACGVSPAGAGTRASSFGGRILDCWATRGALVSFFRSRTFLPSSFVFYDVGKLNNLFLFKVRVFLVLSFSDTCSWLDSGYAFLIIIIHKLCCIFLKPWNLESDNVYLVFIGDVNFITCLCDFSTA